MNQTKIISSSFVYNVSVLPLNVLVTERYCVCKKMLQQIFEKLAKIGWLTFIFFSRINLKMIRKFLKWNDNYCDISKIIKAKVENYRKSVSS